MKTSFDRIIQISIVLIAIILFIPFLGNVHLFDWDEINFAEAAREMIRTGNYITVQIDYHPFWEKPPLFIWMQVLSMKMFGINEFAARFPNAICGVITLLALFNIGRRLRDVKLGLTWVLVYSCSILPFFYFKSGIIDPWFNFFIFMAIYYSFLFILSEKIQKRNYYIGLSAVFIGLGILTKGPVALLIYGLVFGIYMVIKMFRVRVTLYQILLFTGILVVVGGLWFIVQLLSGNYQLIKDFFVYQVRLLQTKDAGHGGFLLYHFVVLFFGVFPASIFALRSFGGDKKEDREPIHEYKNWMMILFWTVLILFTIVRTKIVHYSSICYFPLTFLASYVIVKLMDHKQDIPKWINRLLITVAIFWGGIIIFLQMIAKYKANIISSDLIKDPFAVGNLKANVTWSGHEWLIGAIYILLIILLVSYKRINIQTRIVSIFVTTLVFTYTTVLVIPQHIEGYSQRAAIEFYQEKSKEQCYVIPLGFKSYAHLYYFDKNKPVNPLSSDELWLLHGQIDKPVYVVMKINNARDYLIKNPQLKMLYEKNGFVFAKRELNQ